MSLSCGWSSAEVEMYNEDFLARQPDSRRSSMAMTAARGLCLSLPTHPKVYPKWLESEDEFNINPNPLPQALETV